MREIDHKYTDELVCPYCGHEHRDSWEASDDDGSFWCGECDAEFSYTRHISVSYSTSKLAATEVKP